MAPLQRDQICRFALVGRIHDRPWVNVWYARLNPTLGDSRSDVCKDFAGRLFEQYKIKVMPLLTGLTYLDKVQWVDLHTTTGPVGSLTSFKTATAPIQGSVSGLNVMPGNVAVMVKKQGGGGRGQRNGRCFVPGIAEAETTNQEITTATRNTWNTSWAALRDNLNTDGSEFFQYSSKLVLLHTHKPSEAADPVATGDTNISAITADLRLATIRRRLRA